MTLLRQLREAVSEPDIKHWSSYLQHRLFDSEQEARDFIFRSLQRTDEQFGALFGAKGEEANRKLADEMPVRQLRTGWKVGRVYRKPPTRFDWSSLEIKSNSTEDLYHTAEANGLTDYIYRRRQILPISALGVGPFGKQDRYHQEDGRIRQLAETIKGSDWFECVIVAKERDGSVWLIEGQHRTRAARWFLKTATIPCDIIEELT